MSLVITHEMMRCIEESALAAFERTLASWLRGEDLLPAEWDENEVQRFGRLAIQRGWDNGFVEQRHIVQYAVLAATVGIDFDLDPELREETAALRDSSLEDEARLDLTVERIAAWLDADDSVIATPG